MALNIIYFFFLLYYDAYLLIFFYIGFFLFFYIPKYAQLQFFSYIYIHFIHDSMRSNKISIEIKNVSIHIQHKPKRIHILENVRRE